MAQLPPAVTLAQIRAMSHRPEELMMRACPKTLVLSFTLSTAAAQGFTFDYEPTAPEVVLDTDSTLITPKNGAPMLITGGVFVFRSVRIPPGVTVRAKGSRPMVWIVATSFLVEGTLSARGADGQSALTLNSANFPTLGGAPGPAGGRGGNGSPNVFATSLFGESGQGPVGLFAPGGAGGLFTCISSCGRASGGGGGAFATAGDPYYATKRSGTSFVQQLGQGGYGCNGSSGAGSRSLSGGAPGVRPFQDGRNDNDFFGVGIDLSRRIVIRGELPSLYGGAGGGGGGDLSSVCGFNPNFYSDNRGGGGGGGGGVLAIVSLGSIQVAASGVIDASGGHGGGGELAGSNTAGAGGGGGSGGLIYLQAQSVQLHMHGETYARQDYSFCLAADGGASLQGAFGGVSITGKYPPKPAALLDSAPTGGFGGLGVIQIVVPPGIANADLTNTILDDNITLFRNGLPIAGAEKQRFLAWRGFPNASGVWVDDFGNPTAIGDNEGDMRPSPILLPWL